MRFLTVTKEKYNAIYTEGALSSWIQQQIKKLMGWERNENVYYLSNSIYAKFSYTLR